MKTKIRLGLIGIAAIILSSCNTYFIASSNVAVPLYSSYNGAEVAYNVPTGSVLLLKDGIKNGLTRVRYHSNRKWYWVSYLNLSLIPNINPKYYDLEYSDIENQIASSSTKTGTNATGTGYDATIQVGPRGGKYYINKNGNKTYVPRSTPAGSTKSVGGKGSRGGKY